MNKTYVEMAAYYGVAVIPARSRKPRDKAKVEVGVQVVERWVMACLRHETFFSLSVLNARISLLLHTINHRPFKKLPGSRAERFETLDRPAMRPLPEAPHEYSEWLTVRVNIDYHVEVEKHYYSVSYLLFGKQLEVRLTRTTVELLYRGKRVASHQRSYVLYHHTTLTEHMPKGHQEYVKWTPQHLIDWAAKTGPATAAVVEHILSSRAHPQQGFRSCLGILRLGKTYSSERLEAACARSLRLQAMSYKTIESILKRKLENAPLPVESNSTPIEHDNLRGADYFH